eukprot:CAMPEP_0184500448 /NCGR_PEP_ID=MMETSP0113_2-20130426/44824_1 /TAXON_ID=91329 /ORGANISM="Norrisiella sphaerica, Strain BC52" /LENGTH=54 /DNA_ID=CAMNT_0026888825 /DNA_START=106 /DNA_END=270 /DNA_ORIENTATION=+
MSRKREDTPVTLGLESGSTLPAPSANLMSLNGSRFDSTMALATCNILAVSTLRT